MVRFCILFMMFQKGTIGIFKYLIFIFIGFIDYMKEIFHIFFGEFYLGYLLLFPALILIFCLVKKLINLPLPTNNNFLLKCVLEPIPCVIAVGILCDVNLDIEAVIRIFIDNDLNISPHTQLTYLQHCHNLLTDTLNEQCRHANSKLSHWNLLDARQTQEYHDMYFETSRFYNSLWFHNSDVLNTDLVRRILELTNCGVINDDSYTQSGILKENKTFFRAAWQQARRRWEQDYIDREPLFPIVE